MILLSPAVASELEQLFVKQSSLEVYFEWLDSLIERRVYEVRLYSQIVWYSNVVNACRFCNRNCSSTTKMGNFLLYQV